MLDDVSSVYHDDVICVFDDLISIYDHKYSSVIKEICKARYIKLKYFTLDIKKLWDMILS